MTHIQSSCDLRSQRDFFNASPLRPGTKRSCRNSGHASKIGSQIDRQHLNSRFDPFFRPRDGRCANLGFVNPLRENDWPISGETGRGNLLLRLVLLLHSLLYRLGGEPDTRKATSWSWMILDADDGDLLRLGTVNPKNAPCTGFLVLQIGFPDPHPVFFSKNGDLV